MAAVQAAGPDPMITTFSGMAYRCLVLSVWCLVRNPATASLRAGVADRGTRGILDAHVVVSASAPRSSTIGITDPRRETRNPEHQTRNTKHSTRNTKHHGDARTADPLPRDPPLRAP